MDTTLQQLIDDIQAKINSKQIPGADPTKVLAADEADILTRTVEFLDSLNTKVVPTPQGVEWITPPGTPTFGTETITETSSQISVNGNPRTVAAATLSVPYEDTGFQRIDVVVVNYDPLAPTAAYGIVSGTTAPDTGNVTAPAIPANSLLVRYILVKGSVGSLLPITLVTSASINGGPAIGADPSGKLPLVIDHTTVAELASLDNRVLDLETFAGTAATDINNKANKALTIVSPVANYTLVLTDASNMVRMNMSTANTVTIPPFASVAFPIGTQIVLSQAGTGQTTIQGGSGVTVNSYAGKFKTAGQYAGVTMVKVGANLWTIYGNLSS